MSLAEITARQQALFVAEGRRTRADSYEKMLEALRAANEEQQEQQDP